MILYRLSISITQVNSKSEQYWKDFVIFLTQDCATHDFLIASLMEKFYNKVNNISTKVAFALQDVKNKFLNLPLASANGEWAHHMFGNAKNKK
jgi:hypothetical protein